MSPGALLAIYCVAIVLASVAGGWIPLLVQLTHRRMEIALSFVSGVMLGVAFLHLLPHALAERAAWSADRGAGATPFAFAVIEPTVRWLLGGFLVMFLLERFSRFHDHGVAAPAEAEHGADPGGSHRLTWTGAAIGLSAHSLVAGAALAAAVQAEHAGGHGGPASFGVFLAIVLHKPFDAVTIITLMSAGRLSRRRRHLANFLFGLAVPAGALAFHLSPVGAGTTGHLVVAVVLAFAVGTFLCIALSDVLPELHFHEHDRGKLSVALILGLALAWGAARLEGGGHEEEVVGSRFSVLGSEAVAVSGVTREARGSNREPTTDDRQPSLKP